jgi:hypothetical protein
MQISRQTPFLARQGLSDLLDNSFKMMGRTWKTSLLLSLVFFLPLSALAGWGTARFLGGLAGLLGAGGEPGLAFALGYLRQLAAMLGASLLLWLAGVFVQAAVGAHVAAVASGRGLEPWEAAGLAGRRFFLPSLLQNLVRQALVGGALLVLFSAAVPLGALAASGRAFLAAGAAGAAGAVVAGVVLAVWLSVLLRFAPQAVVFDEEGVFGSLQASSRLVRGSWWRLLGISLVVSIVMSFALGLITLPFTGVAMLPLVSRMVGLAAEGRLELADLAEVFRRSVVGIALGTAGSTFLQAALGAFFLPAFYGLFYVDLKVRKGELPVARPSRKGELAGTRRGRGPRSAGKKS